MQNFTEISAKDLNENPFKLIGDEWTLITAGTPDNYNTMTASWGGVGVLWNKNVVTIYIRPQRYTYEFTENNDYFTLSFFTQEYKKALTYCGKHSGKECDKAKECGLTPIKIDETTTFDQAKLVLVCKKLYHDDIKPENFHDNLIDIQNYPNKDYHRLYIGEIIKVYSK